MPREERYIPIEQQLPERSIQIDRRVTPSIVGVSLLRRLSWQALVVGTLLSLAIEVALFVLGMAVGIYTPPAEGSLTTRIGLWEILMTVGGLCPAGFIAARTAVGTPSRKECVLHGVIIWALTILGAPYLGGRIGVASAFAIPADLSSALWAFGALMAGLAAASLSAYFSAPHVHIRPRLQAE